MGSVGWVYGRVLSDVAKSARAGHDAQRVAFPMPLSSVQVGFALSTDRLDMLGDVLG